MCSVDDVADTLHVRRGLLLCRRCNRSDAGERLHSGLLLPWRHLTCSPVPVQSGELLPRVVNVRRGRHLYRG
jgi:hypothetical protein